MKIEIRRNGILDSVVDCSNLLCIGFFKADVDRIENGNPIILQIADESDAGQDLLLRNYTGGLLEECDSEGERILNPDKPDYDALKYTKRFL